LAGYYRWHAHLYDATRWAFLFGRRELVRRLAQAIPPPARILEVGCGTGTNLEHLARVFPQAKITGIDCSGHMLAKARARLAPWSDRVELREGAYGGAAAGRFDLIVCSYSLSMMNPGHREVLAACRADLEPGGHLAVVDFLEAGAPWFARWMALNHVRMEAHLPPEIRALGFSAAPEVRSAYFGLWRWFFLVSA
jgi:S-adenosylmethionine-diacylgycerolhomoserine-N-methlytransferase